MVARLPALLVTGDRCVDRTLLDNIRPDSNIAATSITTGASPRSPRRSPRARATSPALNAGAATLPGCRACACVQSSIMAVAFQAPAGINRSASLSNALVVEQGTSFLGERYEDGMLCDPAKPVGGVAGVGLAAMGDAVPVGRERRVRPGRRPAGRRRGWRPRSRESGADRRRGRAATGAAPTERRRPRRARIGPARSAGRARLDLDQRRAQRVVVLRARHVPGRRSGRRRSDRPARSA